MTTNKEVYPVTAAFEEFLQKEGIDYNPLEPADFGSLYSSEKAIRFTAMTMLETLGEYEHGSADVINIGFDRWVKLTSADDDAEDERGMLEVLRASYEDILLMMKGM